MTCRCHITCHDSDRISSDQLSDGADSSLSHNKNWETKKSISADCRPDDWPTRQKCGLLFKQFEAKFQIEGRHQISVTLECVSQTNGHPWSNGDVSWVSILCWKMLTVLHPIISDCHCIVFDRRILSAFCSQWITALLTAAAFSSRDRFVFSDDIYRDLEAQLSSLTPLAGVLCCVEEEEN